MFDRNLDEWFSHHTPTDVQATQLERIREAGKSLAEVIVTECPNCPDRSVAIRRVREAVMNANASIVIPL